jgi:hypothetical protein
MEDFIERKETAAEAAYGEMYLGNGMLKCFCGNVFHEDEGEVMSQDPYAMPVCPTCQEDYFKHITKE